jgi:hypothetical protein
MHQWYSPYGLIWQHCYTLQKNSQNPMIAPEITQIIKQPSKSDLAVLHILDHLVDSNLSSNKAITANEDTLQVLQQGVANNKPVFFFYPLTGGVPNQYYKIKNWFGPNVPIFAFKLNEQNLIVEDTRSDILIKAQYYASIMRQYAGPYILLGWSYGGLLAFEVARYLESVGEEVHQVINIDCPPPKYINTMPPATRAEHLIQYLGSKVFKIDAMSIFKATLKTHQLQLTSSDAFNKRIDEIFTISFNEIKKLIEINKNTNKNTLLTTKYTAMTRLQRPDNRHLVNVILDYNDVNEEDIYKFIRVLNRCRINFKSYYSLASWNQRQKLIPKLKARYVVLEAGRKTKGLNKDANFRHWRRYVADTKNFSLVVMPRYNHFDFASDANIELQQVIHGVCQLFQPFNTPLRLESRLISYQNHLKRQLVPLVIKYQARRISLQSEQLVKIYNYHQYQKAASPLTAFLEEMSEDREEKDKKFSYLFHPPGKKPTCFATNLHYFVFKPLINFLVKKPGSIFFVSATTTISMNLFMDLLAWNMLDEAVPFSLVYVDFKLKQNGHSELLLQSSDISFAEVMQSEQYYFLMLKCQQEQIADFINFLIKEKFFLKKNIKLVVSLQGSLSSQHQHQLVDFFVVHYTLNNYLFDLDLCANERFLKNYAAALAKGYHSNYRSGSLIVGGDEIKVFLKDLQQFGFEDLKLDQHFLLHLLDVFPQYLNDKGIIRYLNRGRGGHKQRVIPRLRQLDVLRSGEILQNYVTARFQENHDRLRDENGLFDGVNLLDELNKFAKKMAFAIYKRMPLPMLVNSFIYHALKKCADFVVLWNDTSLGFRYPEFYYFYLFGFLKERLQAASQKDTRQVRPIIKDFLPFFADNAHAFAFNYATEILLLQNLNVIFTSLMNIILNQREPINSRCLAIFAYAKIAIHPFSDRDLKRVKKDFLLIFQHYPKCQPIRYTLRAIYQVAQWQSNIGYTSAEYNQLGFNCQSSQLRVHSFFNRPGIAKSKSLDKLEQEWYQKNNNFLMDLTKIIKTIAKFRQRCGYLQQLKKLKKAIDKVDRKSQYQKVDSSDLQNLVTLIQAERTAMSVYLKNIKQQEKKALNSLLVSYIRSRGQLLVALSNFKEKVVAEELASPYVSSTCYGMMHC